MTDESYVLRGSVTVRGVAIGGAGRAEPLLLHERLLIVVVAHVLHRHREGGAGSLPALLLGDRRVLLGLIQDPTRFGVPLLASLSENHFRLTERPRRRGALRSSGQGG